jgi:hypothetical protein
LGCCLYRRSAPQVQHVYLLYHPPQPRPGAAAWMQLLLDGSGKLALLDRMLQVGKPKRLGLAFSLPFCVSKCSLLQSQPAGRSLR